MRWFLAVLLTPVLALAVQTGLVTPPKLTNGGYVYTVPEGFDPPGISTAGLLEMQGVISKLHHPFYVVIVQKLPPLTREQEKDAQVKGYTQSGDELRATYAVDRLAEDFAMNHALSTTVDGVYKGYDIERSSIFLLSYEPRQFRVLSGSRWKTDLGLVKDKLEPYLSLFRQSVSGSPKNPKGGIIRLVTSYDDFVFDQTDPARVAARADAAAKAKAAREEQERQARILKAKADELEYLNKARGKLDKQISVLGGLLHKPEDYLPLDVVSYRDLMTKAIDVRHRDIPAEMLPMANSMVPSIAVLEAAVGQAEWDALRHTLFIVFWCALVLFGIGYVVFRLLRRRDVYLELKERFAEKSKTWQEALQNAATQYLSAYEKREGLVAMHDVTGRTKEVWDRVTAEVDDIWIGVMALREHVEKQVKLASTATYSDFMPLENALGRLYEPFDFDTGQVNKDQLFAPSSKVVQINPRKFRTDLEARFKANRAEWDRLQQAADARLSDAAKMFPHARLDQLLILTDKYRIPQKWVSDHPLAGDSTEDTALWTALDALKWTDPVFYLEQIESCRKREEAVEERVLKIVQSLTIIERSRVPSLDATSCVLLPMDNPAVTLAEARAAEAALTELLDTHGGAKNVDPVFKAANAIPEIYAKVREQQATIKSAVASAPQRTLKAATDVEACHKLSEKTEIRVKDAGRVHANLSDAMEALAAGQRVLEKAEQSLDKAKGYLTANRFIDAIRKAEHAISAAAGAERLLGEANTVCDIRERERRLFQQRLDALPQKFESERARAAKYTGDLSGFRFPARISSFATGSPTDYGVALREVVAQEHVWEVTARRAQEAHEAVRAFERAQEEVARAQSRRQEQAEAEERRRSSYSSYSTSSSSSGGSSWDSDDSSSGGGGWGGGGSDSGGGGW